MKRKQQCHVEARAYERVARELCGQAIKQRWDVGGELELVNEAIAALEIARMRLEELIKIKAAEPESDDVPF